MIYVQVGLYAEGRSDYDLLLPLIGRLLPELVAGRPESFADLPDPIGIDAPGTAGRTARIASAIEQNWNTCTLFVIHADADRDAVAARGDRVQPGLQEAARRLGKEVPAAGCVPVRELEAWMLADEEVFHSLYSAAVSPRLPQDPEKVSDPKRALKDIFGELGRRPPREMHASFGENLSLVALRRLPAFRTFEGEFSAALDVLVRIALRRDGPPAQSPGG